MRIAIPALTLALTLSSYADPKLMEPPKDLQAYHEDSPSNAFIKRLVDIWDLRGYRMPKDGDIFKWSDYLKSVPDNKPERDDLVQFLSPKGTEMQGLVMDTDEDGVTVCIPMPDSGAMYIHIKNEDIQGFMRPKRLKSDKEI